MRPYIVASVLIMNAVAMPAAAWWDDEHRAVAMIADKHLSNEARQQIKQLLGDSSLAEGSLWPDRIKSQNRWAHSKTWHYMNLARNQDISDYQPIVGGDILWALDYFYSRLKEPGISTSDRRQALQFFVHLVADIHQPLHVGTAKDRGGNAISVRWFNRPKLHNLHQVWDGLLTRNDLSPAQYAQLLDSAAQSLRRDWQNSTFKDWARESKQLLEQLYSVGAENADRKALELGDKYLRANKPIAEKRLAQAGVRLAHYLNRAFAKPENTIN